MEQEKNGKREKKTETPQPEHGGLHKSSLDWDFSE